ncbi:MAG TPA: hypothetical protein PL110_12600, partial [Candidatus Eremiobacteraeota bacterium]|nr:hypothetical protein [Candidatus Eremiobacteraeota bacterium]
MKKTNKKAIVLISVLLLILLLMIMSVSMIALSSNFLSFVSVSETSNKALIAAYAGVDYAIYKLSKDPNWGVKDLKFDPSSTAPIPDRLPTYKADMSAEAEVKFTNSQCNITFGNSYGLKYQSVNNLFGTTALGDVPPYTARIISIGKCGSSRKVIKAYLTRSDFYPYTINSESSVLFVEGTYNIKGDSLTGEEGNVYSAWAGDSDDKFSIQVDSGVKNISCNGGILLGKGPINILSGQLNNTKTKEKCIPELYLSKIDVPEILSNARNNHYGACTNINPGMVTIKEQPPPPPDPPPMPTASETLSLLTQLRDRLIADAADETCTNGDPVTKNGSISITKYSTPEYGRFIIDGGGTGFETVAFFDPAQIKDPFKRGTIKLNHDIFIGSTGISDGDRREYLYDSTFRAKANNPASNNIFRIFRDGSSDLFKMYKYAYVYTYDMNLTYYPPRDEPIYSTDPNTGQIYISGYNHINATSSDSHTETCDGGTNSPYTQEINYIKLDLNGHNIYSRSHLILGVEIIGAGRIIADGKIACLFGVNSEQISCISRDDLDVELSNNFVESKNKGFYYAGDDLNIRPMASDSLLASGTAGNPSARREIMHYPPGYRVNDNDQIIIGNYNITTNDYSGNGIKAETKSHPGYITVTGWNISDGSSNTFDAAIQFHYSKNQQIEIPEEAKILVPEQIGANPKIVDPNDMDITATSGVSTLILNDFSSLIQGEFNQSDIRYYKATLISTSVSLNTFSSDYGSNYQNVSPLDTGSQSGEIYLIQNS